MAQRAADLRREPIVESGVGLAAGEAHVQAAGFVRVEAVQGAVLRDEAGSRLPEERPAVALVVPLHVAASTDAEMADMVGRATAAHVRGFRELIDHLTTMAEVLPEVRPLGFLAVPRVWEKMMASITIRMEDAGAAQAPATASRANCRRSSVFAAATLESTLTGCGG